MNCTNCNREIKPNVKFCMFCGQLVTPVQAAQPAAEPAVLPVIQPVIQPVQTAPAKALQPVIPEKRPGSYYESASPVPQPPTAPLTPPAPAALPLAPAPKRKSKKKLILAAVLLVVAAALVITVAVVFTIVTNPASKFEKNMDAGDFTEAQKNYLQIKSGSNDEKTARKYITSYIAKIVVQYDAREVTADNAITSILEISEMEIMDDESSGITAAKEHITTLEKSRIAFATAGKLLSAKDYVGAIAQYKLVIKEDADYAASVKQISFASDTYRNDTLEKAKKLQSEDDYDGALTVITSALTFLKDDSELQQELALCKSGRLIFLRDQALSKAAEAIQNSDFAGALKILNDGLIEQPNDADLLNTSKEYEKQYAASILTQAAAAFGTGKKYEEAIAVINNGLLIIPGNQTLMTQKSAYQEYKPVSLADMDYFDLSGELRIDSFDPMQDNYSNTYTHSIYSSQYYETSFISYLIEGKYTSFTFVCAVPFSKRASNEFQSVQIFCDDNLVFTSNVLTGGAAPQTASIDVTGVKILRIQFTEEKGHQNWAYMAPVWDPALQK